MPASPSKRPPPLRGADPDSFTQHTVTTRWPRIARRVIDENDFPPSVAEALEALIEAIPEGSVRPIDDPDAPDRVVWNRWIAPHTGRSWLDIPWFVGETYFYRRILEATGYFGDGPCAGHDPFTRQKQEGFRRSVAAMRALAQSLEDKPRADGEALLPRLLRTALWGNQADLSMWSVDEESPNHMGTAREHEHLLADDTATALEHLAACEAPRIEIVADNAGFELVCDLALIDGLLRAYDAATVVVHLKAHPTFVSDAMVADVHATLEALAGDEDAAVRALAERLQMHLAHGQLQLTDAFIWTSPLRFRDFPDLVMADLGRADLLISKGDANYRRLLGDRHWPFTTPFEAIVDYLPAPLLALRTLKAEVAAGLTTEQVERLDAEDPAWLVNGTWGVMQFAPAAS